MQAAGNGVTERFQSRDKKVFVRGALAAHAAGKRISRAARRAITQSCSSRCTLRCFCARRRAFRAARGLCGLAFIVRLSAGKYKTIGTANVTLVARNCRRCFNEALCG